MPAEDLVASVVKVVEDDGSFMTWSLVELVFEDEISNVGLVLDANDSGGEIVAFDCDAVVWNSMCGFCLDGVVFSTEESAEERPSISGRRGRF